MRAGYVTYLRNKVEQAQGRAAHAFQTQHVFLVDASDFAQFFLASFALTLCSQVICEAEGG